MRCPALSRSLKSTVFPDAGPVRILAAASLVSMIGNGLYLPSSMLFFTRVLGFSSTTVGASLTIATVIGVVAGVPIGATADRIGMRGVFIALQLVQGSAMLLFPLARGFPAFLTVIIVASVGQRGGIAVGAALTAHLSEAGDRSKNRAYIRAINNLGLSVGAALSVLALEANSRSGYTLVILGNGVTFLVTDLILLWIPRVRTDRRPVNTRRFEALRDARYITVAALSGVLAYQYDVLAIVIPLWVVEYTIAPHWMVSVLTFLNTLIIAVFQVRAGRGVTNVAAAGKAMRRSGLAFLAGCCLLAYASGLSALAACGLLLLGVLIQTLGELWYAAGTFEVGYSLAQDHAQGEYQGVFNLAVGLVRSSSPAVLTALCLTWGRVGWIFLGAGLAVVGLVAPAISRWAGQSSADTAGLAGGERTLPPQVGPDLRRRPAGVDSEAARDAQGP
jgi:MFS family permease